MEINYNKVNLQRSQVSSFSGEICPALISHAINITSLEEDLVLTNKNNGNQIPFVIIPLSEGEMTVELLNGDGPFTITATEIKASLGTPMFYLCKKVYRSGTTVTDFTVGI